MLSWKNDQVLLWLRNSQQPEDVLESFRIHNITGLTLPMLNSQELKEMGISSLPQRLKILSDIRSLLIEKNQGINLGNLNDEHPLLSELQSTILSTSLIKTISKGIVDETSSQLIVNSVIEKTAEEDRRKREKDFHSLSSKINKLKEEVLPILKEIQDNKPLPSPLPTASEKFIADTNHHIHSNANTSTSTVNSPIIPESPPNIPNTSKSPRNANFLNRKTASIDNPTTLASSNSHLSQAPISPELNRRSSLQHQHQHHPSSQLARSTSTTSVSSSHPQRARESSPKLGSSASNDTLKQLRAKTEDPCYKILQAAMRSHRLDRSEWRKYVLVICYGGDKERVLRYEEKPVVAFKELNELGLSPSIMLRQVDENDDVGNVNYEDYETPGGRL